MPGEIKSLRAAALEKAAELPTEHLVKKLKQKELPPVVFKGVLTQIITTNPDINAKAVKAAQKHPAFPSKAIDTINRSINDMFSRLDDGAMKDTDYWSRGGDYTIEEVKSHFAAQREARKNLGKDVMKEYLGAVSDMNEGLAKVAEEITPTIENIVTGVLGRDGLKTAFGKDSTFGKKVDSAAIADFAENAAQTIVQDLKPKTDYSYDGQYGVGAKDERLQGFVNNKSKRLAPPTPAQVARTPSDAAREYNLRYIASLGIDPKTLGL